MVEPGTHRITERVRAGNSPPKTTYPYSSLTVDRGKDGTAQYADLRLMW